MDTIRMGYKTLSCLLPVVFVVFLHIVTCRATASATSDERPTSCYEAYHSGRNTSGVETLWSRDGAVSFSVYCLYVNESLGYVFPSRGAVSLDQGVLDLSALSDDRTHAMWLKRQIDGRTSQTIVRQLPDFSATALSFQHNSWATFDEPSLRHAGHLQDNFLLVGFLSKSLYAANSDKPLGLESNGQEATYETCEDQTNSYAAFYATPPGGQTSSETCTDPSQEALALTLFGAFGRAQYPQVMDSEEFRFVLELHFGQDGCGLFYASQCPRIDGYAVGLPFSLLERKEVTETTSSENSVATGQSVSGTNDAALCTGTLFGIMLGLASSSLSC